MTAKKGLDPGPWFSHFRSGRPCFVLHEQFSASGSLKAHGMQDLAAMSSLTLLKSFLLRSVLCACTFQTRHVCAAFRCLAEGRNHSVLDRVPLAQDSVLGKHARMCAHGKGKVAGRRENSKPVSKAPGKILQASGEGFAQSR